jgi:hypothetical protein
MQSSHCHGNEQNYPQPHEVNDLNLVGLIIDFCSCASVIFAQVLVNHLLQQHNVCQTFAEMVFDDPAAANRVKVSRKCNRARFSKPTPKLSF